MIGKLTGQLLEKNPPEVLVDCHGVGYEVQVPMSTFYNLPAVGQTVSLLTQFIVREDAQLLYGFATARERAAFRELIKISGVGPRTALSILSGMDVDDLTQAVAGQGAGYRQEDGRALVAGTQGQIGRYIGYGKRCAGQRCAGRYSSGAARFGVQRQGSGGCTQGFAWGCGGQ